MKAITHISRVQTFGAFVRSAIVLGGLALFAPAEPSPANEPPKPAPEPLKLPGIVINPELRCVDVEASVCLHQGFLELIACTKDTKEHESIIAVEARPIHIHTALLLLGARNGNPAMRRALNEEGTRWADLPPRGDLIDVSLEFKDAEGKMVERPISDFIARSDERPDDFGADQADAAPKERFPDTFIFAGSKLHGQGKAPRTYLAELSGHVISIATFGDELLCLPDIMSHENGALTWEVDSTHLPKLGTKVTLRLRVKNPPEEPAKP